MVSEFWRGFWAGAGAITLFWIAWWYVYNKFN